MMVQKQVTLEKNAVNYDVQKTSKNLMLFCVWILRWEKKHI